MEGWKQLTGGEVTFNVDRMVGTISVSKPETLRVTEIPTAAKKANFTVDAIQIDTTGDLVRNNSETSAYRVVLPSTGQSFPLVGTKSIKQNMVGRRVLLSGTFKGVNEASPVIDIRSIRIDPGK